MHPNLLPKTDEAHIWQLDLTCSPQTVDELAVLLSKDELARAERFVTTELRRRFVVTRACLRRLLSDITGISANQLVFEYEHWGKPKLAARNKCSLVPPIHFNVSHSADVALIAIGRASLGVDVEVYDRSIKTRAIESQILSDAESASWKHFSPASLPVETMRLWVVKESLLKAMGLGIAEGLKRVSFPLPIPTQEPFAPRAISPELQLHLDDDGSCRMSGWTDAPMWRTHMLTQLDPHFAALTASRHVTQITVRSFEVE